MDYYESHVWFPDSSLVQLIRPLIDPPFRLVLGNAVPLLNRADQLVPFA